MMEAIEIVRVYLKEHGYDGLCGNGCGCGLDDLAPCAGLNYDCKPAYKHIVPCEICNDPCEYCAEGEAQPGDTMYCEVKPFAPAAATSGKTEEGK